MTTLPSFADIAKLAAAQLPLAAHQVALRLADAHGHLWVATEPAYTLYRLTEGNPTNPVALEAILVAIQQESARLNADDSAPRGIELANALTTFQSGDDDVPQYKHTTASGRLSWAIWPDATAPGEWGMSISIERPAVTVAGKSYPEGIALEALYNSVEGWRVIWGMGAPFYDRHVDTLAAAITATGLVDGLLSDLPMLAHSIHADPRPDWRDGRQWHDVVLAASAETERSAYALIADIKAKFGTEPLRAFAAMAAELDGHGVLARVLRDAT